MHTPAAAHGHSAPETRENPVHHARTQAALHARACMADTARIADYTVLPPSTSDALSRATGAAVWLLRDWHAEEGRE